MKRCRCDIRICGCCILYWRTRSFTNHLITRNTKFSVSSKSYGSQNAHFAPADETTLRLVDRVSKVKWIEEAEASNQDSPGEAELANKFLGISLSHSQTASKISVSDVAAVMEKPGVQTPSRNAAMGDEGAVESDIVVASPEEVILALKTKKPLPAVPKHRHGVPFSQSAKLPINGNGKKVPPKAPPPRRWGRMKTFEHPPIEPIQEAVSKQEA